jgi:hypothetical protein
MAATGTCRCNFSLKWTISARTACDEDTSVHWFRLIGEIGGDFWTCDIKWSRLRLEGETYCGYRDEAGLWCGNSSHVCGNVKVLCGSRATHSVDGVGGDLCDFYLHSSGRRFTQIAFPTAPGMGYATNRPSSQLLRLAMRQPKPRSGVEARLLALGKGER